MSSLKHALLWVSAAVVIVALGFFSIAQADRGAAPMKAQVTAQSTAADQAPAKAQPQQSKLGGEQATCGAELTAPSLALQASGPVAAACPTNTSYTCCPCGGCGCRPRNISPANWCACW